MEFNTLRTTKCHTYTSTGTVTHNALLSNLNLGEVSNSVTIDVVSKCITVLQIIGHVCIHSTDPSVTMSVQPNTTRLPAESPYNTFIIFCNASVPDGVVAPKTLEWRRRVQNNEWQEIDDNGDTIQIETSGLNQSMTTSQLTVSETTPGDYQYQCWITITDLGNNYQDVNVSVIGKFFFFYRRASTCIV